MIESLKNNNSIAKNNDLQSNSNLFNFYNSVSKLQESQNNELPEGFEYDSNGCIICEEPQFSKEDYCNKEQTPIDKLLGGMMKEGEYWGIDYSKCEKPNNKQIYEASLIFIKKVDGHIIIDGIEDCPILILKGLRIIPPHKDFMDFIGYTGTDNIPKVMLLDDGEDDHAIKETHLTVGEKIKIVEELNGFGIHLNDVKEFFGIDKPESEILDILNHNLYNEIDDEIKKQIFGEYSDKIGLVSNLNGLMRIKLKNNLGNNMFYNYIGNLISKLDENGKSNFNNIVRYLLFPGCKINQENMDEYISYINKGGNPMIGEYTINEIVLLKKYGFDLDYIMMVDHNKNILDKIKDFENRGITENMFLFSKDFGTTDINIIEELFVNEKEGKNLFYFLSKYPQKLQNLGGKKIQEIDLNTTNRNFCFRGILEMIKSRGDMNVLPYPGENASQNEIDDWKVSRERIIKEYENLIKNFIGLDFYTDDKGEKKEKNKKDTFDKIFYSMAIPEEDLNGAFTDSITKDQLQSFSKNNVLDYSSTIDENGKLDQTNQKKLIEDVCEYAQQYPNQKILVYVGAHGGKKGSSGNGRTKDDWLKISKYSNIKIMSPRCYFGKVYNNEKNDSGDYIYDQLSQLSGFSNNTTTMNSIDGFMNEGFDLGLGFHELELYTRLNYGIPAPLTESFEYQDWITGEKVSKNIGLAYGEEGNAFDNIT